MLFMAKNEKKSIYQRYKRREKGLYHVIQDYIIHAEMRLNPKVAGKARNSDQIEKIVQKCRELLVVLPEPNEEVQDYNFDFIAILDNLTDADEILKKGEEWRESLSEEEWKEIQDFAKTKQ